MSRIHRSIHSSAVHPLLLTVVVIVGVFFQYGPTLRRVSVQQDTTEPEFYRLTMTFEHVVDGLIIRDPTLNSFEVQDNVNGTWYVASLRPDFSFKAGVDALVVDVQFDDASQSPQAVRALWGGYPWVGIFSSIHLPMVPFSVAVDKKKIVQAALAR